MNYIRNSIAVIGSIWLASCSPRIEATTISAAPKDDLLDLSPSTYKKFDKSVCNELTGISASLCKTKPYPLFVDRSNFPSVRVRTAQWVAATGEKLKCVILTNGSRIGDCPPTRTKSYNYDAEFVRRWFGRDVEPWNAFRLFKGAPLAPFPLPPGVEKKKVEAPKPDYTEEHDLLRRYFSEESCSQMIEKIVASEPSDFDDTLGPSIDTCLFLYSKVRDDDKY